MKSVCNLFTIEEALRLERVCHSQVTYSNAGIRDCYRVIPGSSDFCDQSVKERKAILLFN
jgi:hypothetical protein